LALYHRWRPNEKFVIFTVYMDESGTHGSETMLISAVMGRVAHWEKFEKKTKRLYKRYGVNVFHAKEWQDSDGDFKGWKVDKKAVFLDRMGELINNHIEIGCDAILKMSDYKKYYDNEEKPKKLARDSPYGVCFRAALAFMAEKALAWEPLTERRFFNIVAEQGCKNSQDALRIFEELRGIMLDDYKGLLGTLTFADKRDCLPLCVPDVLAYGTYRKEEGLKPKVRIKTPTRADKTYKGNYYGIWVDKDTLVSLKSDLLGRDAKRLANHGGAR
jgi:hypothetical protein